MGFYCWLAPKTSSFNLKFSPCDRCRPSFTAKAISGIDRGGGVLGTTLSFTDVNRGFFIRKRKGGFSHVCVYLQSCPGDAFSWMEVVIRVKPRSKLARGSLRARRTPLLAAVWLRPAPAGLCCFVLLPEAASLHVRLGSHCSSACFMKRPCRFPTMDVPHQLHGRRA